MGKSFSSPLAIEAKLLGNHGGETNVEARQTYVASTFYCPVKILVTLGRAWQVLNTPHVCTPCGLLPQYYQRRSVPLVLGQ